jgi:hypothetical protein
MSGLIEWEEIDRVAVHVPEGFDALVTDLEDVFGIKFAVVEVPEMNIRAGLSDSHLELVSPLEAGKPTSIAGNFAGDVLVALGFKVKDIEKAKQVMRERGIDLYNSVEVETPGGLKESYMTRTKAFGGIPISFEQYEGDSFVRAVDPGLEENPRPKSYAADIRQDTDPSAG